MHAGEGELVLGLDPDAAQHPHPVRSFARPLEQRRLADPGLAAEHEDRAALASRALDQRIERALSSSRPTSVPIARRS